MVLRCIHDNYLLPKMKHTIALSQATVKTILQDSGALPAGQQHQAVWYLQKHMKGQDVNHQQP